MIRNKKESGGGFMVAKWTFSRQLARYIDALTDLYFTNLIVK
ncbi:MAG: hypothetical protein R2795_18380 [Saprospiraceae bacterium]